MRVSLIILQSLIALTLTAFASAQSNRGSEKRTIEFSSCSWDNITDEVYYISKPGRKSPEYSKLTLAVMNRSIPAKVKVASSLTFYSKTTITDRGEQLYKPVAKAKIPRNCKRATFIFFKSKKGVISVRSIADDRKDSPFGAYQFYNMSKVNLEGFLAEKRFKLKPGSNTTIQLSKARGTELNYGTYATIDGKKRWFARNTLRFNPNKHLKVFTVAYKDKRGRLQTSSKGLVEFKSELKSAQL